MFVSMKELGVSCVSELGYVEQLSTIKNIKGGITYIKTQLLASLEKWEHKEYQAVLSNYENDLAKAESHMVTLNELFSNEPWINKYNKGTARG